MAGRTCLFLVLSDICFGQIAAEKERESVSRARSISAGMPTPSVSVDVHVLHISLGLH